MGKLPLDRLFETVGVELCEREPKPHTDLGGKAAATSHGVHFGCTFSKAAGGAKIRNVFDNGAAQKVGLSAGDVIIAIDGIKTTSEGISELLKRYSCGEVVKIHFFRRDELFEREMVLEGAPFKAYYLQLQDSDQNMIDRRQRWLYGE